MSLFSRMNSLKDPDRKDRKRSARKEGEPRRFHFDISMGGLAALSTALVLAVVWIFILGVLVGRGYRPEETVEEIAGMMDVDREEVPAGEVTPLAPEELEYMESLSKKPETPAPPSEGKKPAGEEKPEETAELPPPPEPAPSAEAIVEPEAGPEPEPVADTPGFAWTFQVASSTDASAADALSERIGKLGYSSKIEVAEVRGDTWHRVLVMVRGDDEAVSKMKADLRNIGINDTLLRNKSPR